MALSEFEKTAGRSFRKSARQALNAVRAEHPDAAPTSESVRYYRHECSAVKGRTRAILLEDRTLTSPEIWVTWTGTQLRVISQEEAQQIVRRGDPLEFETVLAGKFSYTWKYGKCHSCYLEVLSRDGVFKDARPLPAMQQEDLAIFTGGMENRATRAMRREGLD